MLSYDFHYVSANNTFNIKSIVNYLSIESVTYNYSESASLCAKGCKNFNNKFSCPPHSPSFDHCAVHKNYILINAIRINTSEQKRIYNSIRMANVIAKSIQKKAFNSVENCLSNRSSLSFLENGSCRLCKKCNLQVNVPCKYPHKMRPSLEATGIDVNDLVKKAFGFELQWYKKGSFPEYQCVVGGILTNDPETVCNSLKEYYFKTYLGSATGVNQINSFAVAESCG